MSERDRAALQQLFDLITNIHRGELGNELTDNMRRATEAARERHSPSKVTLTFTFTPGKGQDDDVMYVAARSEASLPKVKRGEATYFAWSDGTLRRQRELQAGMFDDERPQLVKRVEGTVIQPGESEDFSDDRSLAQ